jgi:hypothetical protein
VAGTTGCELLLRRRSDPKGVQIDPGQLDPQVLTYQTPEFLNSKAGENFVDEPPTNSKLFFTYIVHAVGYRPHTASTCLPGIFMHPHRMDDRGSVKCKTPGGNHGCLTHRQEHGTRQLPLWRVVVSSRCLRLASAPPWERPPEISTSRNLDQRPEIRPACPDEADDDGRWSKDLGGYLLRVGSLFSR